MLVTDESNQALAFSVQEGAFSVGTMLGPAIGGVLAGRWPPWAPFAAPCLFVAFISAVGFVLCWMFLDEVPPISRTETLATDPLSASSDKQSEAIDDSAERPDDVELMPLADSEASTRSLANGSSSLSDADDTEAPASEPLPARSKQGPFQVLGEIARDRQSVVTVVELTLLAVLVIMVSRSRWKKTRANHYNLS